MKLGWTSAVGFLMTSFLCSTLAAQTFATSTPSYVDSINASSYSSMSPDSWSNPSPSPVALPAVSFQSPARPVNYPVVQPRVTYVSPVPYAIEPNQPFASYRVTPSAAVVSRPYVVQPPVLTRSQLQWVPSSQSFTLVPQIVARRSFK